jgi:hypothetical protein
MLWQLVNNHNSLFIVWTAWKMSYLKYMFKLVNHFYVGYFITSWWIHLNYTPTMKELTNKLSFSGLFDRKNVCYINRTSNLKEYTHIHSAIQVQKQ